MEAVREYLLKIVVCGILGGIATGIAGKFGAAGKLIKMITGVCMLLTLVSPVLQLRIGNLGAFFNEITSDADAIVSEGENLSAAALEDIIKARTEAYILDKADTFGASLSVDVGLSDEQIPKPSSVRISGSISPYGKRKLQSMIRDDLGIALEDQIWIG